MKHKTSEMLNMLHQEHIVAHLKSLSHDDQLRMVSHIESLDLSVLNEGVMEEERGKFEPLYAITLDDIARNRDHFTETGLDDAPPPAALAQAKDASNIGGSALLPQLGLVKLLCPWLHFVFALLCLLYI